METRDENTITKERVHPGIFAFVGIVAFGLALPTLPILFIINSFDNALAGMNPHGASNPPLLILVLVPDFLILAAVLAIVWAAYVSCEITLTNRRILFRTGLIARQSGDLPLENVEIVYVSEGLLGRLLGFGTVTVTSVGGQSLPLQFIGSPHRFKTLLNEAVRATKERPAPVVPPPQDDSRYMPKR